MDMRAAPARIDDDTPDALGPGEDTAADAALGRAERALIERAYRAHYPAVLHLLQRRLGNPDDAAELAQEAFLRLMRYRHCSEHSLRYLLFRVALNLAASQGRTRALRPSVDLDENELVSELPQPDEWLEHQQGRQQLAAAVASLPPRCRQMIQLSRLQGLRTREVAARAGLSTRMVERHLQTAQGLLRARLVDQ